MSVIGTWNNGSHTDIILRVKTTHGGMKSQDDLSKMELYLSTSMAGASLYLGIYDDNFPLCSTSIVYSGFPAICIQGNVAHANMSIYL